MLIIARDAYAS